MLRRVILPTLALIAVSATFVPATAQEAAPDRTIEVRFAAVSRGYAQPLNKTAKRIEAIDGIRNVEAVEAGGDTVSFRLTSGLNDADLAGRLGATVLGRSGDVLVLAPATTMRAKRAEARRVIMQIVGKINETPKPTWNSWENENPIFTNGMSNAEKLSTLGLDPKILDGVYYRPSDYHIDETWTGGANYKIWAGDQWEGVFVPSDDWWFDGDDEETPAANPESNFVGVRISRSAWSSSFHWVDVDGLSLTIPDVTRDEKDGGELLVKKGADWMSDIMAAACAYRIRMPNNSLDQMPEGRGWRMFGSFDMDGNLDRWELQPHYSNQTFELSWENRDENWIATLKAHHEYHPLHLHLECNTTAVVNDYKERAEEGDKDFSDLQSAELGESLTWIVKAEENDEIFERRRQEARDVIDQVIAGLANAEGELTGNLGDEALRKRLGVTLPENGEFSGEDYVITKQLLGDVEIAVGSNRTGRRFWVLANGTTGKLIRSYR